jgi:hypothetical protein
MIKLCDRALATGDYLITLSLSLPGLSKRNTESISSCICRLLVLITRICLWCIWLVVSPGPLKQPERHKAVTHKIQKRNITQEYLKKLIFFIFYLKESTKRFSGPKSI